MSRFIGEGTHGTVCKVIESGRYIAVKKMKSSGRSASHYALEVSIMCTYDHPYLNKCIRVERSNQGELLLYQELAERDLGSYIKSTCHLSEELARTWINSIATGLRFLKHEFIVHGDIKPQNILVYRDASVKLADFGCAAILDNEYVVANSGTTRYSSPETLMKNILSHEGDVWSLGCVIYEMLMRTNLIPTCIKGDDNKRFRTVKSIQAWRRTCGDTDIDSSEDLGPLKCLPIEFSLVGESGEIVNSMLRYHGRRRMTVEQLLQSKWLNSSSARNIVDISCSTLDTDVLAIAINHIESYASQRAITLTESVTLKAASIYTRTSMEKEEEIEASLVIAQRLFRAEIQGYHPLSPARLLEKTVVEILSASNYRIHKHSMSELYIKLGK